MQVCSEFCVVLLSRFGFSRWEWNAFTYNVVHPLRWWSGHGPTDFFFQVRNSRRKRLDNRSNKVVIISVFVRGEKSGYHYKSIISVSILWSGVRGRSRLVLDCSAFFSPTGLLCLGATSIFKPSRNLLIFRFARHNFSRLRISCHSL